MPILHTLALTVLLTAQVAPAPAEPFSGPIAVADVQDDETYLGQVYDIRDLTSLDARYSAGLPHVPGVIDRLCDAMGLPLQHVSPGLVWVQGTPADHDQLQSSLARVRELYKDRYELHFVVVAVDGDKAPAIGAALETGERLNSTRQVVSASQPAEVRSLTTYRYVHGFEPVVGDNASGYSTVIEEISEGLMAIVAVDPTRSADSGVALDIRGAISSVDFTRTMPFHGGQEGMRIDLPSYSERSFESHLTIPFGQLTTLCVVDDFAGEGAIVIAARVTKVK